MVREFTANFSDPEIGLVGVETPGFVVGFNIGPPPIGVCPELGVVGGTPEVAMGVCAE
jgi:hypothetical protein